MSMANAEGVVRLCPEGCFANGQAAAVTREVLPLSIRSRSHILATSRICVTTGRFQFNEAMTWSRKKAIYAMGVIPFFMRLG